MLDVTKGPMNHLSGRRQGRNPLRRPLAPPTEMPCPPGMFNVQDCYFDYGRADAAVRVDICELLADPYIVSHISTGYSDLSPEAISQVLVASGEDGTNGVTQQC